MYVWASITPIGITACVPESPPGCSRSAWDGGGVGLEEVELIGWIFIDSTTNYNQKHKKKSSCDKDERNNREGCSWEPSVLVISCIWMKRSSLGDILANVYGGPRGLSCVFDC